MTPDHAREAARRLVDELLGPRPPHARAVTRTIAVGGRRRRVRLEPAMWDALSEMARAEKVSVEHICALVAERAASGSLAGTLRCFILMYFQSRE